MENSQVLTSGITHHTDHMAKDHRQKGGVPRDCDRQVEPFQQTPDNIKECQMEVDEVLEEDLDEEAVKPFVDPEDNQARVGYIQCVDVIPCSVGTEEVVVHE